MNTPKLNVNSSSNCKLYDPLTSLCQSCPDGSFLNE